MTKVTKTSLDEMGIVAKTLGFTIDNARKNGTMFNDLQNNPDAKLSSYINFRVKAPKVNV